MSEDALNRRQFSKLVAAGAAGLALPQAARAQQPSPTPQVRSQAASRSNAARPNIVFIMADDLGYNHLGCYGQEKIKTPHLDQLAAEGVRFTQAYAGSTVCAPSRSSLMTGTHTGHTSVRGNSGGIPLRPEDVTVAEVLSAAGYTTGCFGKWGLGDARTPGVPTRQGFDEYFGTLHQVQAHFYYPDFLWQNEEKVPLPGNEGDGRAQYSNDLFTEHALSFIREQAGQEDPFFCYVPYTIPHTELLVPEDSMQEYLDEDGQSIFPETPYVTHDHRASQEKPHAAFAAMITRMDDYVGQIVAALEEEGVAEETLVIFVSDNGGQEDGAGADLAFFEGNRPLRGWKGNLYEGGIRVPAIMRWPGQIEAGTVSDQVWAFWDVLPTLAELGGAAVPAEAEVDGLPMAQAWMGAAQIERDYLYWEVERGGELFKAVRMGDWKAVRNGGAQTPVELYYLPTDPAEKFDRAAKEPARLAEAKRLFEVAHVEARPQIEPEANNDRTGFVGRYRE